MTTSLVSRTRYSLIFVISEAYSLTVDNPPSKQVNLVWSRGLCSSNILYIGNRYIPFFVVTLASYCKLI